MDCLEGTDFKDEVQSILVAGSKTHSVEIGHIKEIYSKYQTMYSEIKPMMDMAFKEQVMRLAFDDVRVVDAKFLLSTAILCAKEQICSESLPCVMFADLVDCQTLDCCQQLFSFLEENVSTFKSPVFFTSCRNHILRTCNDLQKRLSKSTNPQFCGRILMFLASFFPPSDRSGINLPGNFHAENVTSFDKTGTDYFAQQQTSEDTEMVDLEEGESVEVKSKPVDYIFYCKFWSMQEFFRDPHQCYTKKGWLQFMNNTNDILSVFKSLKLEDNSKQRRKDVAQQQQGSSDGSNVDKSVALIGSSKDGIDTAYFAKYLTNQKLLELQLDDNKFRRSLLVQFLILLQYLTTTTKFKKDLVLKAEQVTWVDDTTNHIYDLLEQVPPNGAAFANFVRSVLKREEFWNEWKNGGCKDRGESVREQYEKYGKAKKRTRRKSVAEEMAACHGTGRVAFGQNKELERLWNLGSATDYVIEQPTPDLYDFFKDPILELNPAALVEKQYRAISDSNFQWKALRLLAAKSPNFFQPSTHVPKTIVEYLEMMLKGMGAEWRERGLLGQDSWVEVEDTVKPAAGLAPAANDNNDAPGGGRSEEQPPPAKKRAVHVRVKQQPVENEAANNGNGSGNVAEGPPVAGSAAATTGDEDKEPGEVS